MNRKKRSHHSQPTGPALLLGPQVEGGPKILEKNRVVEEKKKKNWFQMNYKNNLAHPFNQKTKILVNPTKHWF